MFSPRADLGHTFWDFETWQFPALAPFHPEIGQKLLEYREDRLAVAEQRAAKAGYAGAMWPWESAVSGETVCGYAPGNSELHINGDIAMGFRLQYHFSRNDTWLRDHAWPVLAATARFWASRISVEDSTGTGNYTVKRVVGPDESSGYVDDEAYTNAIAGATLAFAAEAGKVLGLPVGANWTAISTQMYLPIVSGLYPGGPIHLQDRQYKHGKLINQAAVGLLQYPLEVQGIAPEVKRNDLLYYESVTAGNGFYTGDSSYSIAWLALGNRTGGDAQFARTFLYLNGKPPASAAGRAATSRACSQPAHLIDAKEPRPTASCAAA